MFKKNTLLIFSEKKDFNETYSGLTLFSYYAFYVMPILSSLSLCFLTVQHTQAEIESLGVRGLQEMFSKTSPALH